MVRHATRLPGVVVLAAIVLVAAGAPAWGQAASVRALEPLADYLPLSTWQDPDTKGLAVATMVSFAALCGVMLWERFTGRGARASLARPAPGSRARPGEAAPQPVRASRSVRVGMPLRVVATPFLLANGKVLARRPETGGSGSAVVMAVGVLRFGGRASERHRLYLDSGAFYELRFNDRDAVTECVFHDPIDEIVPSPQDWGDWLDPRSGVLHSPAMELNGVTYARVWGPPTGLAPPSEFEELLSTGDGPESTTLRHIAMRYRRSTGLGAPAPEAEYVLVEVVEDTAAARASVRRYAGLDIDPATLGI